MNELIDLICNGIRAIKADRDTWRDIADARDRAREQLAADLKAANDRIELFSDEIDNLISAKECLELQVERLMREVMELKRKPAPQSEMATTDGDTPEEGYYKQVERVVRQDETPVDVEGV